MCWALGCGAEEKVVGTHKAPGSCPFCGGAVEATDVEKAIRFCFLPMCLKTIRRATSRRALASGSSSLMNFNGEGQTRGSAADGFSKAAQAP
ncbi:hypothetical protein ZIOFF_055211 [Zingiber officinale]|uniref:Uncharacterized protein n=1 Tax=Zingiber officinale TaxID=94328 RepID=A0A8J5KED5_ZINOF|nr:hypothetical protein ZIOFF_055211 [Zingiber officinale]